MKEDKRVEEMTVSYRVYDGESRRRRRRRKRRRRKWKRMKKWKRIKVKN